MANSRHAMETYETWLIHSHASSTLNRQKQLGKWINGPTLTAHTHYYHAQANPSGPRTLAIAAITLGRPTFCKINLRVIMNSHTMQLLGKQNNRPTRSTQYPAHNKGWPAALGLARTTHLVPTVSNIVQTTCSVNRFFSNLMVTPEDKLVFYENESFTNRTSYILNRYCDTKSYK